LERREYVNKDLYAIPVSPHIFWRQMKNLMSDDIHGWQWLSTLKRLSSSKSYHSIFDKNSVLNLKAYLGFAMQP
jgi:hypothetical protein